MKTTHLGAKPRVVCCGENYLWECGLRLETAAKLALNDLPGYDLYGRALTVVNDYFFQDKDDFPDYNPSDLVRFEVFPKAGMQNTVLILSDSICITIGRIEGGTVLSRGGATFRTLLDLFQASGIWFNDYYAVIIHCGINDAQRGSGDGYVERNIRLPMHDGPLSATLPC